MKNPVTVYIVTAVHNHWPETKRLLSSIAKQNYSSIAVFVVDDGSTDGTCGSIKKKYPEIKILKGNGNLWWTGAMKWAVDEVLKITKTDDFILTINNDCIFDKNYVKSLVESSLNFKRAIVGSLVVDINDHRVIYDAGTKIDWKMGKFISLGPKSLDQLEKNSLFQEDIDTLSTKGTIFPVEVFKKIGNFDQKHFPHYLSDYEFSCRAKKNGFKLALSYRSIVYNDIRRTGLGDNLNGKVGLKKVWQLLFSRKSKVNLIDNLRFIKYCCPKKYRFLNYLLLIKKMIKYI